MGLILISCSLKPIDWTRSVSREFASVGISVNTAFVDNPFAWWLVTHLPSHEKVTMTSALRGWQAVSARFEQSIKRQRAEHHEERASSLRLAVANHEFQSALWQNEGWEVLLYQCFKKCQRKSPCVQSKQFVLLTKRWGLSLLRNTNITNYQVFYTTAHSVWRLY